MKKFLQFLLGSQVVMFILAFTLGYILGTTK
jgi:hypothetical protein